MSRRVTVVGDALLDRDVVGKADRLCPDAPVPVIDRPVAVDRPGGAGLAALLAAGDGVDVTLVTPLAGDAAGDRLASLLDAAGVTVVPIPCTGATVEKVRIRAGAQSIVRLDYGGGGALAPLSERARTAVESADAVLVSDYGGGTSAAPDVRAALAGSAARTPVVWDPHPRGCAPVGGVRLATPNVSEALLFRERDAETLAGLTAAALGLLERWRVSGVAVTRGAGGALLVSPDGTPLVVPAPFVRGGDSCGAGDRFAAAAAVSLARGALLSEAVVDAVQAASAFVAAGGAAEVQARTVQRSAAPAADRQDSVIDRVRTRGGTVVATGGCFDLLHAGHVRMLEAARALGDCLVVCLNSDDSVRRIKGPDRPVVPARDRAEVLGGLACVDAVVVFDDDTPERLLAEMRPDVWAKGADYAVTDLPEAPLVASWGGQVVVLPYLDGRSTTRLLQEVTRREDT